MARAAVFGGILVLGLGSATAAMAKPADIVNVNCGAVALGLAVQNAQNGEILMMPEGCTYSLTSGLTLDKTVTIIGDNDTILGSPTNPGFSLLTVTSGACVTIDDVDFANGGGLSVDHGGAIYNDGGTVKITGGFYSGNAAQAGGAIYNAGALWLTSTYFENNQASNGGAVFNDGPLEVSGTTFSGNGATGGDGGAIDNVAGDPVVQNSSFLGNTAVDGGAIYNCGDLEIEQSMMSGNTADYGGAIYENRGELLVSGTTIEYNTAYQKGGAIYNCSESSNICLTDDCIRYNTPENCYPDDLTGCMAP